MSARTVVRPLHLGARVVARIREAMEFRCFTVEDLAGATDMQPTILARRLVEPARFMLGEMEAIRRGLPGAGDVPVDD